MAKAANLKVFFDLDGTLIDISFRHFQVYSNVVKHMGGRPLTQEIYWGLKRKKAKWQELLPMSQIEGVKEPEFLTNFIERIEAPENLKLDRPFPGTLSTLQSVSQLAACYLVSLRRNEENLVEQVAGLGFNRYFDSVLSGHSETDGHDKKIALIKQNLRGSVGAIIGDTEADVLAGQELHMTTIAMTTGIRDERFLADLHPDYLLDDIAGLVNIVNSLG